MNWHNISHTRPGFSVYEAKMGTRTYVCQKKKGFGLWRLFVKEKDHQPLRTIYAGSTLGECKIKAEEYEDG